MEYPQFGLSGRVALVTGAARGLGRAISLALANAGADAALGLRNVHSAGDLPRELETIGQRVLPQQMDVMSLDQISRAFEDAVAYFGRLDILLINAASGTPGTDEALA